METESDTQFVTKLQQFAGHSDKIWAVSWHPLGELFATCSSDKSVKIWSIDSSEPSKKCELRVMCDEDTLSHHQHACVVFLQQTLSEGSERTIRSVSFSPDGHMLACGSFDSTITVYAMINGLYSFVAKLEGHDNEVKCVQWDSTGKYLASCSRDKTVWVWDYEDGYEFSCYAVIDAHTQDVKHVTWVPLTSSIVSCSFDDSIKIWKSEDDDWRISQSLTHHSSIVWCVALTNDAKAMASCSEDKSIRIYKQNTEMIDESSANQYVLDTTFTDAHLRQVYSVSFSHDGTFLASGGADNCVNVYQKNLDRQLDSSQAYEMLERKVNSHFGDVNCVAFHPSKDILVTVSDDRQVRVWDVQLNV